MPLLRIRAPCSPPSLMLAPVLPPWLASLSPACNPISRCSLGSPYLLPGPIPSLLVPHAVSTVWSCQLPLLETLPHGHVASLAAFSSSSLPHRFGNRLRPPGWVTLPSLWPRFSGLLQDLGPSPGSCLHSNPQGSGMRHAGLGWGSTLTLGQVAPGLEGSWLQGTP